MKTLKKKTKRKFVRDNMRVRTKDRPAKAGPYGVEVYLVPISTKDRAGIEALDAICQYIRTLIKGSYKITSEKKRGRIYTRLRLESETDVMMLMLKNSSIIGRIYRYV